MSEDADGEVLGVDTSPHHTFDEDALFCGYLAFGFYIFILIFLWKTCHLVVLHLGDYSHGHSAHGCSLTIAGQPADLEKVESELEGVVGSSLVFVL